MKTISFLFVAALLAGAACRSAETSRIDSNVPVNSSSNQQNLNLSANSPGNTLSNTATPANSTVNADMLRQIEAQQAETADPRNAANKAGNTNGNQPLSKKPAGSSQRQTW
jgi:hypothetical protein